MYFDVDIASEIRRWWESTFTKIVTERFQESPVSVVVLQPGVTHSWSDPVAAGSVLVELHHGDSAGENLLENAAHKLRFTLRTGTASIEAQRNLHLVEAGDFPHGGAVIHKGLYAAASGLVEESDVWVAEKVIDQIVELRRAAAQAAFDKSLSGIPGWKYLDPEHAEVMLAR